MPGRLDRRHAVDLGPGPGRQAVCDLVLDHDQPLADRGEARQQVQQHRHGDVVREVRHERLRLPGQRGDLQSIFQHDLEPVGGLRAEAGDVFEIEAAPFTLPLRNPLAVAPARDLSVKVL